MAARQFAHDPLLQRMWRYVVLGSTSIVFEETNPVWGGIKARHGHMSLVAVVSAVAVGTWLASAGLYALGRWRIDWVRARWPSKERALDAALEIVRQHPWRASLAVRFAYGLRLPVPIACGAARLPFSLYLIASGISCWVWAGLFTWLGFAVGRAVLAALAVTHRLDVRLGLLAIALVIALVVVRRRRVVAEKTARVLSGERLSLRPSRPLHIDDVPPEDPGSPA